MEIRLERDHLEGSDLWHRWGELEEIYMRKNTISNILKSLICERLELKTELFSSNKREKKTVRAREIYCGLMRILSDYSLPNIGKEIKRNHSSVFYFIENFKKFYKIEKEYRHDVHSIAVKLNVEQQKKVYKFLKGLKVDATHK